MTETTRNFSTIIFLLLTTIFLLNAQTTSAQAANDRPAANENFELNIAQDRITELNFQRATDVQLVSERNRGVQLEIGVGVRAEQINILLRGITGQVKFRASLESIKQRIEQRRQNPLPN